MSEKQTIDINIDPWELIQNKCIQKQNQFTQLTFYSLNADREGQDRARFN